MTNQKPNIYTKDELLTVIKTAPLASPAQLKSVLAKYYGVSYSQAKRVYNKYVKPLLSGVPQLVEQRVKVKSNLADKTVDASVTVDKAVELDDVIKICKIDTKKWATKGFSVEERASGAFNWKASFERNKQGEFESLIQSFINKAEAHSPKQFSFKKPNVDAKYLYVIQSVDLHLGKLAWSNETNWESYDIKIAKRIYTEAIDNLMAKAPINKIETVLIVCGSDYYHCDSPKNETSAGTRLDADSRWAKMYDEGCALMADTIEKLASRFKVEVMVVLGNHASVSEYCLGAYVKAYFRNHPNVNVNNKPSDRKYFGYGNTLIGFVHGDGVKNGGRDLPMVMFRENQETISNYKFYQILMGDKHTERVDEIKGVVVRTSPALCPPDFWHSKNSFVGNNRNMQALLYNKEFGIENVIYSKPATE